MAPSGAPPSVPHAARSAKTPVHANLRRRSPLGAGPVAQWESVRFTRGRSLVRSQPGPQASAQIVGSGASLDTTRGPAFGPFMRPSRRLAARRKIARHVAPKNFLRPLSRRAPVQTTTELGCAPTTSQQTRTRSCGRPTPRRPHPGLAPAPGPNPRPSPTDFFAIADSLSQGDGVRVSGNTSGRRASTR